MSVFTDYYVASPEEATLAFSWLNVPSVGDQPSADFDKEDFAAFEEYSELYDAWRERQPFPEPNEAARRALVLLPKLEAKFVFVDELEALRAIFEVPRESKLLHSFLSSPGALCVLERLEASLVEALGRAHEPSREKSIQEQVAALARHWRAGPDPKDFVPKLRSLCRLAVEQERSVFVLIAGDG